MNELKIFKNEDFGQIRTTILNNETWFIGKDVAEILGYANGSRDINRHVDDEDKIFQIIPQYQNGTLVKTKTILINESGLYSLILSSKMPKAKEFKRWVTSEVLPSIRKHGLYAKQELLDNPDLFIQALTELKKEREEKAKLIIDNQIKNQQIAELKPKASYYDLILQCKDLISVTEISKDYGMSAKKFNSVLHDIGVQFRQSKVWFLYSKYQNFGYTQTKTQNYNRPDGTQGAKTHMYWTQKGRLFLYDLLKTKDIIPIIERV